MYLFGNYEDDLEHFGLENRGNDYTVEGDTFVMGRYSRLSSTQKRDHIYELLELEGKGREKEYFPELYEENQERRRKWEEAQEKADDARDAWLFSLPPEERYKHMILWPTKDTKESEKTRTLKK